MQLPPKTGSSKSIFFLLALPFALQCSTAKIAKPNHASPAKAPTSATEHSNPPPSAPDANHGQTVVVQANVGGNAANNLPVQMGVRNFQAINMTMSTLTKVPTTNAAVAAAYAEQNSALPTETDVKAFVGSSQVAVFKLAVEYCNALITDPSNSAAFFESINITDVPSNVFTAAGSKAISDILITKIWGSNLSTLPPLAQSSATLSALISDLLIGKTMTSKAVTTGVLVGACTAVLAAAPVTLY